MGVCPSRAERHDAITRCTQTTYAYHCSWFRIGRYYNFKGSEHSVEAPGVITITKGYVRDVATQGPTTCIRDNEFEGFEEVDGCRVGDLVPIHSEKFNAEGRNIRLR